MHIFELWLSLDICPSVGFLGHMVDLLLVVFVCVCVCVFYRISILFYIDAVPVYILAYIVRVSFTSHSLSTYILVCKNF